MTETITRADIAKEVHRQIGLSQSDSEKLVKEVFHEIIQTLITDNIVKISSFGSFIVRHKKARTGRNPKTGVDAKISERRSLTFRAGDILKERVQNAQR